MTTAPNEASWCFTQKRDVAIPGDTITALVDLGSNQPSEEAYSCQDAASADPLMILMRRNDQDSLAIPSEAGPVLPFLLTCH